MAVQTLTNLEVEVLSSSADKVIIRMANNQTAKERFDIGDGYNKKDYLKALYLKKLLLREDTDIQEESDKIKSELNHLKNQYL